jgi:hypothetical protein
MDRIEALGILGDGHTIWSVECAQGVCATVGVQWAEALGRRHYSSPGPRGATMEVEGEVTVACSDLTAHVMHQLGVKPDTIYHGRGAQARHNAAVIAAELNRREEGGQA